MSKRVGAQSARQNLPELIERAARGQTTIVTKHGKPCAAIVPVPEASRPSAGMGIEELAGSGKGLWGKPAHYLRRARAEW